MFSTNQILHFSAITHFSTCPLRSSLRGTRNPQVRRNTGLDYTHSTMTFACRLIYPFNGKRVTVSHRWVYPRDFRSIDHHQKVLVVHSHMFDRRQHTDDAEKLVPANQSRVSVRKSEVIEGRPRRRGDVENVFEFFNQHLL